MTYDNFTIKAQESILRGQQIAGGKDQQVVDTSHLILGILEIDEKIPEFLFNKIGINLSQIRKELNDEIAKLPKVEGAGKQYLSNDSNKALAKAKKLLKEYEDEFISVELILLGIIEGSDATAKIIKGLGGSSKAMKDAITELRKGRKVTDQTGDNQYNALKKFAINLNERAESGELDPIIGRDEEIRRILHILSRRKKNNPILIGEAGVGKTAIWKE